MNQPKVLVIQDISASCQISMNVALPILSSLNNSTSILPTALLSTHTGSGFEDYTFLDLTSEMEKILDHWRQLEILFDGVLIGYLGSHAQMNIVKRVVREFTSDDAIIVLDPVMGDHGELYTGFDDVYVKQMQELCQLSTVVIPNMTEAAYLTQTPYHNGPHTKQEIESLMEKMLERNQQQVILTGVMPNLHEIGAASSSYTDRQVKHAFSPIYPGHFDGTGDLFSSVVAGLLFQKATLETATETAVAYVEKVIQRTVANKLDPKFGVQFETDLPYLMEKAAHLRNE
ncbi:pyridoxamine kinase [Desemzia sp. RIT804]|uniref:pyridoxamine kinase n=1 Tax=Desemzia sp. RIT 804 TaxID=2810209 RepID=UPI00194E2CA9|nr:pyridoxamine kinase [Desemzia sp. RIT 804]MBM6616032.1 pyridoxamine kinase [Desemzia sp. RIT 804]